LTDSYNDCDINILTVKVLAGMTAAMSGLGIVLSILIIYKRLPISMKKMSDPTILFPIYFLGGCIGAFIFNVPKSWIPFNML
jgi:hypothetical protein